MKTLAFLQTHIITEGIINEYKKLENSGNVDCILFLNNLNNQFEDNGELIQEKEFCGQKVRCFLFNNQKLQETGLPCYTNNSKNDRNAILWYNADYSIYITYKYFSDYDYYWRIEYDDFFNDTTWRSFFETYENDSHDLIIPDFREADRDDWSWHEHSDWIYKDIKKYRSFFPIVRVSNRAAGLLYKTRLEHKEIFKNISLKSGSRWVFCECFVPTEIMKNNLTAKSLDNAVLLAREIDLNEDRIWQNPDKKLYHPVKGNYNARLKALENKIKQKAPLFFIGRTEDYTHFLVILFGIKMRFRINEKV